MTLLPPGSEREDGDDDSLTSAGLLARPATRAAGRGGRALPVAVAPAWGEDFHPLAVVGGDAGLRDPSSDEVLPISGLDGLGSVVIGSLDGLGSVVIGSLDDLGGGSMYLPDGDVFDEE